jgi:hypothetical protein
MPAFPQEYLEWQPPAGYKTQSADTTPQVERFLFDRLASMPVCEKARQLRQINETVERLAVAGIRKRHPGASDEAIRIRLAALRLDRETMLRAYDWDPDVEGL